MVDVVTPFHAVLMIEEIVMKISVNCSSYEGTIFQLGSEGKIFTLKTDEKYLDRKGEIERFFLVKRRYPGGVEAVTIEFFLQSRGEIKTKETSERILFAVGNRGKEWYNADSIVTFLSY